MLQNLRAEMMRYGITAADLSRTAKRTERSIRLKVAGKTAFTRPEGIAIRDAFFPGMSLEYLFARTESVWGSITVAKRDSAQGGGGENGGAILRL